MMRTLICSSIVFLFSLVFNSLLVSVLIAALVFLLFHLLIDKQRSTASSRGKLKKDPKKENSWQQYSQRSITSSTSNSPLFQFGSRNNELFVQRRTLINHNEPSVSDVRPLLQKPILDRVLSDGTLLYKPSPLGKLPKVSFASTKPPALVRNIKRPCTVRLSAVPMESVVFNNNQSKPTLRSPTMEARSNSEVKNVVEAIKSKRKRVLNESSHDVGDPSTRSKRQRNNQIGNVPDKLPLSVKSVDAIQKRTSVKRSHHFIKTSGYHRPNKMFKNNEIMSSYASLTQPASRPERPSSVKEKNAPEVLNEVPVPNQSEEEEKVVVGQMDTIDETSESLPAKETPDEEKNEAPPEVAEGVKKSLPKKIVYKMPAYLHSMEEHARDYQKDFKKLGKYVIAMKESSTPPPTPTVPKVTQPTPPEATSIAATVVVPSLLAPPPTAPAAAVTTITATITTSSSAITTTVSAFTPITSVSEQPSLLQNGITNNLNFQFSATVPESLKPTEQPKPSSTPFNFSASSAPSLVTSLPNSVPPANATSTPLIPPLSNSNQFNVAPNTAAGILQLPQPSLQPAPPRFFSMGTATSSSSRQTSRNRRYRK